MTVYRTEEEQWELAKELWKKYGKWLISAIVLVILLFIGWRYWNNQTEKKMANASVAYQAILESVANNKMDEVEAQATALIEQYKNTTYASLSNLLLAKVAVEKNELDQALVHLNAVISSAKDTSLRQIARLRMARILITSKKIEEALKLLDQIDDAQYISMIEEIRGDIYMQMGDLQKARAAYLMAIEKLPDSGTVARPILNMKYQQIATEKTEDAQN